MVENETMGELLALSQQLVRAIEQGDWAAYSRLCADDLTAFEPEARGQLVAGLEFHQFYFDSKAPAGGRRQSTIASPRVRVMGDAAVVAYVRVVQIEDASGQHLSRAFEETRVWERRQGQWRHVHFHRSPLA